MKISYVEAIPSKVLYNVTQLEASSLNCKVTYDRQIDSSDLS